jgi:hypothetical protein
LLLGEQELASVKRDKHAEPGNACSATGH